MINKMIIIGNIYGAGVYTMETRDGRVLYVGSSIQINDAVISRHLYNLKRGKYIDTNKAPLQLAYDREDLVFKVIHESEHNSEINKMTIGQKEDLQKALSVLEMTYIELYKETICNQQRSVTKHSSNKDEYSTHKRRIANTGVKNPNAKYDSSMISEILWFKLNNYKPKIIKELIENYYKIDMNKSYIGQIGVQKWIDLVPTIPVWFNESEVM